MIDVSLAVCIYQNCPMRLLYISVSTEIEAEPHLTWAKAFCHTNVTIFHTPQYSTRV